MGKVRLWLIYFDEAHPNVDKDVVMQCNHEPTEIEAEQAVHETGMTMGTVWVNQIQETSESEMRGKKYHLVGAKI